MAKSKAKSKAKEPAAAPKKRSSSSKVEVPGGVLIREDEDTVTVAVVFNRAEAKVSEDAPQIVRWQRYLNVAFGKMNVSRNAALMEDLDEAEKKEQHALKERYKALRLHRPKDSPGLKV